MTFLSLLVAGISLGAMYALVAMGFVIVYKYSRILNFAQGSVMVFGAMVVSVTHDRVGFYVAVLLGLLAAGLLSLVLQLVFVGPMRRHASAETATILTIGIDVLLSTFLIAWLGADLQELGQPWGGSTVSIGGVGTSVNRLIGLGVAVVLLLLLFLALNRSAWGISMRAAAEDPEAATLVGLKLDRIGLVSWFVAGVLACVAGIFLTGAPTPGLSPSLITLVYAVFPAAAIGGLASPGGALIGGMITGIAESLATGYQDRLSFLGSGFGTIVPFIVMALVLLVRPEGLIADGRGARV